MKSIYIILYRINAPAFLQNGVIYMRGRFFQILLFYASQRKKTFRSTQFKQNLQILIRDFKKKTRKEEVLADHGKGV